MAHDRTHPHDALKERVKELRCLYQVARLDESELPVSRLLEQACALIKEGFQFPERAEVCISFKGRHYRTDSFADQPWRMASASARKDVETVTIEVMVADDGTQTSPLLEKEEQELLDTLADLLATKLHHKRSVREAEKDGRTLRNILANSLDVICTIDPEGRFVKVSAAAKKVWGYAPEELEGRMFMDFVHPDDHGLTAEAAERITAGIDVTDFNNRYVRKDGRVVPMTWSARWDAKDGLMYCVARDATEKLAAQEQLARSEKRFRALAENGADAIVILDAEGYATYASASVVRVLGYTEEEALQMNLFDVVHPDDLPVATATIGEVMRSPGIPIKGMAIRARHRDGTWRWMGGTLTNMLHDPDINGIVDNFRDVTETVELQRMLDSATELARMGAWEIDMSQDRIHWSPMTRRIHEVLEDFEPDGEMALNFYREDVRETVIRAFTDTMTSGRPFDYEMPIITAKGNERWVRVIGEAEFADGKCVRVFGSFQDIHQRKMAEVELQRQHRFLTVVHEVVTQFMRHDDWHEVISNVLEKVGRTVDVDRAYYFEGFIDEAAGGTHYRQLYEWNSGTAPAQLYNQVLQDIDPVQFPQFFVPLERGEPIICHTAQQEGEFKEVLVEQEIVTVLNIPIIIHGHLHGFIGFDDCRTQREWAGGEMPLLQSVVSNLTAAIERKQATDLVKESHAEQRAILESISDGFFTVNRNWTVTYWNKEAERLTSLPREAIIGKNLWEVFSDAVGLDFYAQYHLAMEENRPVKFEEYYPALDMWADVSVYPSEKGLSIFFRDVTGKKRAEEQIRLSNERYEKVTEATQDAIWDWDLTTDTVHWGDGHARLFGYEAKDMGHSVPDWTSKIHVKDLGRVADSLFKALEDPNAARWEQEYRYRKADGSHAHIVDRGTVIRDSAGRAVRMVGAMTDITELKQQQERLHRANMELERSNQELEQFAYIASHDLQEPLRMVTSFLDQLKKKYEGQLDDRAQQYIEYAHGGALRMRQTILDLLQFSRAGRVGQRPEAVDVNVLVTETLHLLREQMETTGAEVTFRQLPTVVAARTPLQQVFQNLIANAITYHRPGVAPRIAITASYHGQFTQFSVKDNGMGIDPQYFDKVFLMFQRLHGRDEIPGSGIGLAVCKKVVERHGGTIWTESEPGKGSTFHFTLRNDLEPYSD